MYGGGNYEAGGLGDAAFSFSEKSIRMAFVRYVFITVTDLLEVEYFFILKKTYFFIDLCFV